MRGLLDVEPLKTFIPGKREHGLVLNLNQSHSFFLRPTRVSTVSPGFVFCFVVVVFLLQGVATFPIKVQIFRPHGMDIQSLHRICSMKASVDNK